MAVLYAPGRYFACRDCGGLSYATQSEGAGDRASTKAGKLRKRMGWQAGILNGEGCKPKGMHWKTYFRLKSQHDALVQVNLNDVGRKLSFLHACWSGKSVWQNVGAVALVSLSYSQTPGVIYRRPSGGVSAGRPLRAIVRLVRSIPSCEL